MAKTSSVKDVIVQALAKNRKDSESDRKSPEDYVLVEEIDVHGTEQPWVPGGARECCGVLKYPGCPGVEPNVSI